MEFIVGHGVLIHCPEIGDTVVLWEGQPTTLTFYSDMTDRKLLEGESQ